MLPVLCLATGESPAGVAVAKAVKKVVINATMPTTPVDFMVELNCRRKHQREAIKKTIDKANLK